MRKDLPEKPSTDRTDDKIVHFQTIQSIILHGKTRALQAATAHSLVSYWNVGAYLSHRLTENSYGKKVVDQLVPRPVNDV